MATWRLVGCGCCLPLSQQTLNSRPGHEIRRGGRANSRHRHRLYLLLTEAHQQRVVAEPSLCLLLNQQQAQRCGRRLQGFACFASLCLLLIQQPCGC